jgi:sodium/potassium-transporting ATPase subunit alpha
LIGPYSFVGLVSLSDPPKAGAREAVTACRAAGIRVTVVTGDHPLTAESISRQIGIVTELTAREVAAADNVSEDTIDALRDPRVGAIILTGASLENMNDEEWTLALSHPEVVFARTTPIQKASIVAHYQKLNHVVMCTGDGVNDAPALKASDIGVSMGSQRASDVAREAADVVILDDNWAHIVDLVSESRLSYANVRKTMAYTLSHAIPELIPVCLAFIFDLPLMLTGMLILVVDLITEQIPSISLVHEPSEAILMQQIPRDRSRDHLLDVRLILYTGVLMAALITLAATGAFLLAMLQSGYPVGDLIYNANFWRSPPPAAAEALAAAVSGYFWTLVVSQAAVHVFLTKTSRVSIFTHGLFRNKMTLTGAVVAIGVAVIVIFVLGGSFFGCGPMPQATSWCMPLVFALVALPVTEAAKAVARAYPNGAFSKNWLW